MIGEIARRKAAVGPQRSGGLRVTGRGLLEMTFNRPIFFDHQGQIVVKGQQTMLKALDRQGFEQLPLRENMQQLLLGIDLECDGLVGKARPR